MKYIFIRNDDVRGTLDESLIRISDLCISKEIPICHTVEPANVSREVVSWLLSKKKESPELIEIVQHGYSHKLNYKNNIGGKIKKGEFGGKRSYIDQFNEIKEGKELLDKYFNDDWFPLFTFPYGARNENSLRALRDVGFLAVNGSMGVSNKHKILYSIGRLLDREMVFGRKISYNLRIKKKYNIFQIDTAFSIIKQYFDDSNNASFYNLDELKRITNIYIDSVPNIGIVLHHRYHDSDEKIELVDKFFSWLKRLNDVKFVNQKYIYETYSK